MNEAMIQIRKLTKEIEKLTNVEEDKQKKLFCSIGEKDFLTLQETMAYLSVSQNTINKWREAGLRTIKLGDGKNDKVYFSKKSIAEFMEKYAC